MFFPGEHTLGEGYTNQTRTRPPDQEEKTGTKGEEKRRTQREEKRWLVGMKIEGQRKRRRSRKEFRLIKEVIQYNLLETHHNITPKRIFVDLSRGWGQGRLGGGRERGWGHGRLRGGREREVDYIW